MGALVAYTFIIKPILRCAEEVFAMRGDVIVEKTAVNTTTPTKKDRHRMRRLENRRKIVGVKY